ncbi:MAG: hypothetical protein ACHQJ6_03305 [Candidatus Berkiellales bacterium]
MFETEQLEGYTPKELKNIESNLEMLERMFVKFIPFLQQNFGSNPIYLHCIKTMMRQYHGLKAFYRPLESTTISLDEKIQHCRVLLEKIKQNIDFLSKNLPPEISEPFSTASKTIEKMIPTSTFLVHPVTIKEVAWLIHYRLQQFRPLVTFEGFEADLQVLLKKLRVEVNQYQEGNIAIIDSIIAKIETFNEIHAGDVKEFTPWLLGILHECQIIQKRHQAVSLRHHLDEINIKLIGKRNEAELEHARKLNALAKRYKISTKKKEAKPPAKNPFDTLFKPVRAMVSFFNLAADVRREKYLREKQKLNQELKEKFGALDQEHKKINQAEIDRLEGELQGLKSDIAKMDSHYIGAVVAPLAFDYHCYIKKMAVKHGGMVIGGLSQSTMISLGSSSGLCYGFTKDWVVHMNLLREQHLEDYVMIDNLNLYTKASEAKKATFSSQVNNLLLNEKTFQHFDEQDKDKFRRDPKFSASHSLDDKFSQAVFSALSQCRPESLIIGISSPNGNGHALGIVQTPDGIWFHDSNHACIYFPIHTSLETTKENFSKFLSEYLKEVYGKYNNGYFIPISEKADPQVIEAMKRRKAWVASVAKGQEVAGPEVHLPKVAPIEVGVHRKL